MKQIPEFQRFLEEAYAELEEFQPDVEQAAADAAQIIQGANDRARKVGAGHLAVKIKTSNNGQPCYPVAEAKSVIGRMLKWCREQAESEASVDHDGPYTVAEAAVLLGVSKSHVYDLCREGKLGSKRHGQAIRITREQLDEYEKSAERAPVKTTGFRHL